MAFRLSTDSLDWALSHVEQFGDTDIFPTPFEFQAIRHEWDAVRSFLASSDLDLWIPRTKRQCLTPKGKYAYRVSTQLDPLDCLIYLALTFECGGALEAFRIAAAESIVISHRFAPASDGSLYDRSRNWGTFLHRCQQLANEESISHVVIADVSDFYHRLGHHPLDNTLDAATDKSGQARVLMKLFGQWSGGASYGIPVGPSPSRLIADVAIDDVDQYLRAEGATFCRYSDDYRMFCTSYKDAYEKLARLADLLYRNHGLTLQQHKSFIVTVDRFSEQHLSSPESEELRNLMEKFDELIEAIGLSNRYEDIEYEDLDESQQELVDQLNLENLLRQQLASGEWDIGLTKFILRRLAQLDDYDVAEELVNNAERCYPVIAWIIEYLRSLRTIPEELAARIGTQIIGLVQSSYVGHLPYHRCWLLSLFASERAWNQEDKFVQLHNGIPEPFARRKLVLAMGRSRSAYWFRGMRASALTMEPWERRAFLAAASCLADDERKFWYQSLRGRVDPLEEAVVSWAKSAPF